MIALPVALALLQLSAGAVEANANGYLDSRLELTSPRTDGLLAPDDTPRIRALIEANLQLKLVNESGGYGFADLSLFFQDGGSFLGRNGVHVPAHDVPSLRNQVAINELYWTRNFGEHFELTVGKRRVVWGSGIADNPTDVLNAPKDPTDPGLQRAGAWMLEAQAPFDWFTVTALWSPAVLAAANGLPQQWLKFPSYDSYESEVERAVYGQNKLFPGVRDADFHQLFGLRAYFLVAETDVNVMYYWSNRYDSQVEHQSRFGASFSHYFGDYEVHGEAVLQHGSDRLYAGPAGETAPFLDRRWFPRVLLGGRTTFKDQSSISLEYLFQGDGYSTADFQRQLALLTSGLAPVIPTTLDPTAAGESLTARFTFQPIRRQYALLGYTKPQIADDWTVSVIALVGLQDLSAVIAPSVAWSAAEWVELRAAVFGAINGPDGVDIGGRNVSEFGLAPFTVRGQLEARFFY